MKRHAFTLTERLVSLCVIVTFFGFAMMAVARLDGENERTKCASNLRQIGQALLLYSTDNRGPFPRTKYDVNRADKPTSFTGIDSNNPFAADCRQVNDVSAALSPADEIRKCNSPNHGGDGQNVLYGDMHVEFSNTPLCGKNRDNIYTYGDSGVDSQTGQPRPTGGAGVVGSAVGPEDSVLLPVASASNAQPPSDR